MKDFHADLLVDPTDSSGFAPPELDANGDGLLTNASNGNQYPVRAGVAVFVNGALPKQPSPGSVDAAQANPVAGNAMPGAGDWSFSREWDEHFDTGNERTWGYTVQERFEQLLMECQVSEDDLRTMTILDAGCGNGSLTNLVARKCATVVGIDFSSSVHGANRQGKETGAQFVQGDLLSPPLAAGSFDLIFSIGVLHHTPDTRRAFDAVAKLVKPGGKMYVWLYRRPENFLGRCVKVPIYDGLRWVISRLSAKGQDRAVGAYARLVHGLHSLRRGGAPVPLREYVISAYDDLACRWRYYHHPIEVARWFHENGFSAPTLSHWDNPYGFGVVATRVPAAATPGISYGDGVKLWDPDQTLLGRLHKD